jgi:hypothetical protein
MSCGILMFAYNNASVDYTGMAFGNALLIKRNMPGIPICLATNRSSYRHLINQVDESTIKNTFDHVLYDELIDKRVAVRRYMDTRYTNYSDYYHNVNRTNAYDISPFDQTLLLDTDYLILDDSLNLAWNCQEDFMCNRKTITLDHDVNSFGFDNRFNSMSIPLYWATAIYFTKTERSQLIFELINYVKDNYEYYQYLYGFHHSGYFRNDFALSIAMHMVNNMMEYGAIKSLPIDHILVSMETDEMHDFIDGCAIITSEPQEGDFRLHSVSTNVHVMNKFAIMRNIDKIIKHAIS